MVGICRSTWKANKGGSRLGEHGAGLIVVMPEYGVAQPSSRDRPATRRQIIGIATMRLVQPFIRKGTKSNSEHQRSQSNGQNERGEVVNKSEGVHLRVLGHTHRFHKSPDPRNTKP